MAIPASELVNIVPRVVAGSGSDLAFNGMILTKNAKCPVDEAVRLNDAEAVQAYFGVNSDEAKIANVYFQGFDNSRVKPASIFYFRHAAEAVAPFVRSAAILDASAVIVAANQISAGSITLTLGEARTASSINLSSATSLSEIANIVQTAIRAATGEEAWDDAWEQATVVYDATIKAFTITAGKTGEEVAISAGEGDVAILMQLDEDVLPVVSKGANARTYTETMNAATNKTQNFVTLSTAEQVTDDEADLLAQWASVEFNAGNQFLYIYWSNDAKLTKQDITGTAPARFKALGYTGTCAVYGDVRYAAFIMACAGSIDWDGANSTITLAFKKQSGLPANVEDKATSRNMNDNLINFVGNFATRNDNFVLFYSGCMFGDWSWIDTYLNATWLNNALQVQIMAGLQLAERVPYTNIGYAQIRSWCLDVLSRAINNGAIESGVRLSETQKNQLQREAGQDISDNIYNMGYHLQILDATPQVRQQRRSPQCALWYTYGGSVHKINMPSTAVV